MAYWVPFLTHDFRPFMTTDKNRDNQTKKKASAYFFNTKLLYSRLSWITSTNISFLFYYICSFPLKWRFPRVPFVLLLLFSAASELLGMN